MTLFLTAVVFFAPKRTVNDWLLALSFSALFGLPGLFAFWWVKKTYVVTDENGLLYSHWRGATRLRWADISDYYLKKSDKYLVAHIEAKGRVFVLNHILSNGDDLQKIIQEKAQSSRAKNWELFGTRTFDEWPRVFRYKNTSIFLLVLTSVGFPVLIFALQLSKGATYGGWAPMWSGFLLMWNVLSLWGKIGFAFVWLALASCLSILFLATRLPRAKATKSYLQQTISADLQGLIFQTPNEQTPIAWNRVLDYYLEPVNGTLETVNRCMVVTEEGEQAFLSTIEDAFILREIIKKYATNARSSEWKPKAGQNLDNLKAPSHFAVPRGSRLYHFRTRSGRALLLFFTLIFFVLPVPIVSRAHNGRHHHVLRFCGSHRPANSAGMARLSQVVYRNRRLQPDFARIVQNAFASLERNQALSF